MTGSSHCSGVGSVGEYILKLRALIWNARDLEELNMHRTSGGSLPEVLHAKIEKDPHEVKYIGSS